MLDYHEGAVDEGRLKKTLAQTHKKASDLFRKANTYVKSSSGTDVIYQKIMDKETAFEAGEAFKLNFEASAKDQPFKICTKFFVFCWVNGGDVSFQVAKLRNLWNELNNGLMSKNLSALSDLILVCKILHISPINFKSLTGSYYPTMRV